MSHSKAEDFMLTFWRKRKNLAVHLAFWPIIAVFIIWGFERYGNPVGTEAAVVDGHTISMDEYRKAVQRTIDFYSQIFQGNFDEKAQEQYRIKEAALGQLVEGLLVSDQAEVMGLRPTDAELRDSILNEPYFQKDGHFARENYDIILRNMRMTPAQFENEKRKELLMGRMNRLFEQNIVMSGAEKQNLEKLKGEKRNVEFLRLEKESFLAKGTGTEAEVQDYLKSEKNLKDVREYYDLHQGEFSKPEEVWAKHILVKATPNNSKEESAAKEKIQKIKAELTAKNFSEMANKYSEDPGSQKKGGDLGWFGHGRMVPEFEKVAFSLEPGTISEPLKTNFGYHIIYIQDKHPLKRSDFNEVKGKIAQKFLARQKLEKSLGEIDTLLTSNPEKASGAFEKLTGAKKWDETGPFSLADEAIPKLGDSTDLQVAALSVGPGKKVWPKLVKEGDTYYLVRFKKSEAQAKATKEQPQDSEASAARNIFAVWRNSLREKAKLTVNPQLKEMLGGGSEPADMGDF